MVDSKNIASSLTGFVKQLVLDEYNKSGDEILECDTDDVVAAVVAELAELTSDDSGLDLEEHVTELLTTKAPEEPTCDHPQLYAYLNVTFSVPIVHNSAQAMNEAYTKVDSKCQVINVSTEGEIKYWIADKIEICEYPNENT